MSKLREELREFNAALAAEGHALPYLDGGKVAFTKPASKKKTGKAA